ncbi:hypothetical protein PHAVU_004G109200 [Phaseolus vulgaris]|uniref:Uncharacterized protein n=1 Tax=Phaseolus vulgaris TaxID=3885 RepID=V7C5M4_PHAVU|nr:hypothetical protein PHAVU_004G109200g [Phaseolus vulgaris]ESW24186.1 hypothetical protein PHAVU_004G109200g [Phaseolus vulgaris]
MGEKMSEKLGVMVVVFTILVVLAMEAHHVECTVYTPMDPCKPLRCFTLCFQVMAQNYNGFCCNENATICICK